MLSIIHAQRLGEGDVQCSVHAQSVSNQDMFPIYLCKDVGSKASEVRREGIKNLFIGYCKGIKAYWFICLETQKIIKSPNVVFFKDKMHLEDCPSGKFDETRMIKVDIILILDIEELEANILDQDEESDMEEEAEAKVPATKFTHSSEVLRFDASKKTTTIPLPTPQYNIETMSNLGIQIGHPKGLENCGRATFCNPKIKNMQIW